MPQLKAFNISMSVDGFMAGPGQTQEDPLGADGESLHEWVFDSPGPVDSRYLAQRTQGVGATIMGRNMYGPVRGEWGEEMWRGWWGEDPPYHHPTFVLTHHPHEPVEMDGGTTFYFVTDGPAAALELAFDAAGGADVALGGGASTIRQFLDARLLDELNVAIAPVLLGAGERIFDGPLPAGYGVVSSEPGEAVLHVVIGRTS
ncbi:bifunctional deaminase-reductase domain protein [Beutenbergia cavernae DSM 12333]|uniref:Bifunctional deaminase-reductase domain protein n=1 Tax=Beutenbergia cavernae (strain ATCC BAA-8 / DSM 12333 / CCUG 43141 / JCM 11478 / NBRC 16432 / NCIMB 13614 / HKI 0122) TaxID=471853 RepID=C5C3U4_BEUC1|nr:dihydrofolate reductase family protein [Beutenbergia cavernae]ACQ82003.1 bifunctional deaminase-reductase domain protein [Beutenbergia cavernae DSM 12333]